jgi:hypothetical protein
MFVLSGIAITVTEAKETGWFFEFTILKLTFDCWASRKQGNNKRVKSSQ